jgi:geranylgeranyl diphosphate synthase type II
MSDIPKRLKDLGKGIEDELMGCFERQFDSPDIIVSAMKYSIFAGGKRLRPILLRETCRIMGGDGEYAAPLSWAIEMIHTYSLIHDDLPAMDDDDFRRGEPTNHKVYGENIAILAGDALLNFAMETALNGMPGPQDPMLYAYCRAMQVLFSASGVDGMIGGQTGDILCEADGRVTEEKLDYIHRHKTGALLKAAVVCGGLVADAQDDELEALAVFGERIGLAFQIVDDILDVMGNEEELGKPIGSDEKNHKSTFVSLYGLVSSQEKVKELRLQALEALDSLKGHDTSFLRELTDFICFRVN